MTDKRSVGDVRRRVDLKFKTFRAKVMLRARSHSRFRVRIRMESNPLNQSPALEESRANPLKPKAKITIAPKPVRVNPATPVRVNDIKTLSRDIESCESQDEKKTGEDTDRAQLRRLELPAPRLVIAKRLLNIKAKTIVREGLQASGFITENRPKLPIEIVATENDMYRAIPLAFVELDVVPAKSLPRLEMKGLGLAPPLARTPEPNIALAADAVMPTQALQ